MSVPSARPASRCHINVYATAALDGIPLIAARARLDALYTDHLIDELLPGRYRMHDLIRAYAQELAADDPIDARERGTCRLLDYYQYVAESAGRYFTRVTRPGPPIAVAPPATAPDMATSGDAIAWMAHPVANLSCRR